MLQPEHYWMARHEARFHVQVAVLSAGPVERTPGPMPIEARVVRVFRSDGGIGEGDLVHFNEQVTRQGDEIPFGGMIWKPYDGLLSARHLEVFLDGDPPNCAIPLCQSKIIDSPTARPHMRGWFPLVAVRMRALRKAALATSEARPWWRFWA